MCSRSSWRLSRYHGALEGFGVWSGFEWSWSGALKSAEITKSPSDQTIAAMNSMRRRCGQTIAVSSTRADKLSDVVTGLKAAGARAAPVALDVRSQASIDKAMAAAVDALGGLDEAIEGAATLAGLPPRPRLILPRKRFSLSDLLKDQLGLPLPDARQLLPGFAAFKTPLYLMD